MKTAALTVLCLAVAGRAAADPDVTYRLDLSITAADDDRSVAVSTAVVNTGMRRVDCAVTGGAVKCDGALRASERLGLRIDPSQDLFPREISFALAGSKEHLFSQHVHIAPRTTKASFGDLRRIVGFLDRGWFDRGLSLAEVMYEKSRTSEVAELRANSHFNYARALQNACLRLSYDTCDRALELFDELKEWKRRDARIFALFQSKLEDRLISKAIGDVHAFKLQMKTNELLDEYEKAVELFNGKNATVCAAGAAFERIANGYDRNRALWEANGLWEWRLLFELGGSRLRCAVLRGRDDAGPARDEACQQIVVSLALFERSEKLGDAHRPDSFEWITAKAIMGSDRKYAATLLGKLECPG